MPTMPFLPEELIALILDNLDPRKDGKTIHALRLTSKMFHRIATPLIYPRIIIRMATSRNTIALKFAIEDQVPLGQLMENPEWTSLVKEVQVRECSIGMSNDEREALSEAIENDDDDLEIAVSNAINDIRRDDARVAFLLLRCTNLEVLNSSVGFAGYSKLMQRLFHHVCSLHLRARYETSGATIAPGYLGLVREVTIEGLRLQNSVRDALTLLCLPSLHTLRLTSLADSHVRKELPPPHDGIVRNTNRMNLVFDMCTLSPNGLDAILQTAPNAKALTLRRLPGPWNDPFDNSEFCDLLRSSGQNLEKIHLDCFGISAYRPFISSSPPWGDFSELSATWLAVPIAFFGHLLERPTEMGSTEAAMLLPRNLRELFVIGLKKSEKKEMCKTIGRIALKNTGMMQRLKRVAPVTWDRCPGSKQRYISYHRTPRAGFEIESMSKTQTVN